MVDIKEEELLDLATQIKLQVWNGGHWRLILV